MAIPNTWQPYRRWRGRFGGAAWPTKEAAGRTDARARPGSRRSLRAFRRGMAGSTMGATDKCAGSKQKRSNRKVYDQTHAVHSQ